MAARILCLCLHLLFAAAVATRLPATTGGADCHETVTKSSKECAGQFIQAVFTGKKEFISQECCVELACVREWTCATVLRSFCLPPEAHQCDPSPAPAPTAGVYA